jgi:hypothetical protein
MGLLLPALYRMVEIIVKKLKGPKKFVAIVGSKRVYFGDSRYEDFTTHKDLERRRKYLLRHAARENWGDWETAGFYSRWLLWNKPSLSESVRDVKKRFGINIVLR